MDLNQAGTFPTVFFASFGSAFLKSTQRVEQEKKEHEFIHST